MPRASEDVWKRLKQVVPELENSLIDEYFVIAGGNFDNAGKVSSRIKAILKDVDFPRESIRRVALVAYEAEINIVSYARTGFIRLRVAKDRAIIDVIDEGDGIPDIDLALQEGYSTATTRIREMGFGAGMGLSNIKNFSDVFYISSDINKGTYLQMIIFTENDLPGGRV
jgi:anti-sigma regulatory factor (Ser/Thr protein kinase)